MAKKLIVDIDKCTGCRICEVICSMSHEQECNPKLARVRILKWENAGIDLPIVCHQCRVQNCRRVCPKQAIGVNKINGAMVVDEEACIGCELCVFACPFGAPLIVNRQEKPKAAICDLCGGTPKCAQYCDTGAIRFVEMDAIGKQHKEQGIRQTLYHLKKRIDTMESSKVLSKIIR
jgi:Fe-S-cluster-containing hydrogenase component 2